MEPTPNIDAAHNPWTRGGSTPAPILEFVGRTNESGGLRVVSGIFNLRDAHRFPHAVVPDALRIGFVVVADGFLPSVSERRFTAGGTLESRTIQLLDARDHGLFASAEWTVAEHMIDAMSPVEVRPVDHFEPEIARLRDNLTVALAEVGDEDREAARKEAEARLWERLGGHLPPSHQLLIARRALGLTPRAAARLYRLALLIVQDQGVIPGAPPPRAPVAPTSALEEAERLLRDAVETEPHFLPAYPLLDQLLVRRGATPEERRGFVNHLLRESPFDPWARARMAVFMLKSGRDAEAFDHLRYTYMSLPGIGGDRELALALSAYYWRIGLPEKAGAYAWLLTGRVPEDPFAMPRGVKP